MLIIAYFLGLLIIMFSFGILLFHEMKARDALIVLALYPVWLTILTIYLITIFIYAIATNQNIESIDLKFLNKMLDKIPGDKHD